VLRRHAAAGRAAGLHRLEGLAVRDAAADLLDDVAQRGAHVTSMRPGVDDGAGQREDLGALGLLGADAGEPAPPLSTMGAMLA
jgi:hypothetical protein